MFPGWRAAKCPTILFTTKLRALPCSSARLLHRCVQTPATLASLALKTLQTREPTNVNALQASWIQGSAKSTACWNDRTIGPHQKRRKHLSHGTPCLPPHVLPAGSTWCSTATTPFCSVYGLQKTYNAECCTPTECSPEAGLACTSNRCACAAGKLLQRWAYAVGGHGGEPVIRCHL